MCRMRAPVPNRFDVCKRGVCICPSATGGQNQTQIAFTKLFDEYDIPTTFAHCAFRLSGRCCGESGLSLRVRNGYACTCGHHTRVTGTPCVRACCPIRICKTIDGHHTGGRTFGVEGHNSSQIKFVQQRSSVRKFSQSTSWGSSIYVVPVILLPT